MPTDYHSCNTLRPPYQVGIAPTLSEREQQSIASLLGLLPAECIDNIQLDNIQLDSDTVNGISAIHIKNIVDGRGLACPMPLLKTKVALRNVNIDESLYVVATDPNSRADITAFCQQTQQLPAANILLLVVNQATYQITEQASTDTLATTLFDTIYHFIITKTDSN